jgi:HlyD family secretion protein
VDRADAQLAQLESELRAARAGLDAVRRQAEVAQAELQAIDVSLGETMVAAPVAGVVQGPLVRVGEVTAPGLPLLRLRERDEVTVRIYLPIAAAQRVRAGIEARAYVEGIEGVFVPGVVERIAEEAEFTPRDVHMPDDRTTLVLAVTLRFPNSDGFLKHGFPADVFLRWDPGIPWPARPPWR